MNRSIRRPNERLFFAIFIFAASCFLALIGNSLLLAIVAIVSISFAISVGRTYIQRLFFGYLVFYCLNTNIGYLSLPVVSRSSLFLLIYIAISLLIIILRKNIESVPLSNNYDMPAIIGGLILLIVLLIPVINLSSGNMIRYGASGEDNASHFAIVNNILNNRASPFSQEHQGQGGIIGALYVYPQGMHINYAINSSLSFKDGHSNTSLTKLIKRYIINTALVYSLLFVSIWYTGAELLLRFKNRYNVYPISIVGAILYFLFIPATLSLYLYGFHSQISAYFLFAGLMVLLSQIDETGYSIKAYILLGLVNASIAQTWYFLTPLSTGTILIYLLLNRRLFHKKAIPVILTFGLLTILPVAISLIGDKRNLINFPGAIYPIQASDIFLYILGICIAFLLFLRFYTRSYLAYLAALILTIAFTVSIYIYQIYSIGHLSYYFYKSLYSVTLLFLPIVIVFLTLLTLSFRVIFPDSKTFVARTSLFLIAILSQFLLVSASHNSYLASYYNKVQYSSTFIDSEIIDYSIRDYSPKTTNQLIVIRNKGFSDYMTSRWLGALFLQSSSSHQNVISALAYGKDIKDYMGSYIKSVAANKNNIVVLTNDELETRLILGQFASNIIIANYSVPPVGK